MLSKQEALSFLTKTLQIISLLEKVSRDPYSFLVELIEAFMVKIPHQSLFLLSIPPHLRRRYTR